MIARPLRWPRRLQLALAHRVSMPFHRFFNRFPKAEAGHTEAEITSLTCRHTPLAGRRAVQISDLHLDRYHSRHDKLLHTITDLNPDWIFVTGDLLTVADGLPDLFRFLAGLRATAPVYLTLGNHDHYSGVPVHQFMEWADRHKLHLLINQAMFVPTEAGELGIVGLDDPSLHRADLRCIPPQAPNRFTVLLAHAPNVLDHLDHRHAVDLVLCGHSHGGQWRPPFIPLFWLPYGCQGRGHGHYRRNGHRLYVNRGLGWSLLPLRWNCPPEIVVIDWVDGAAAP
ncbi:MAG: metallophosphoesterase [Nitrospiraceae bacterium]